MIRNICGFQSFGTGGWGCPPVNNNTPWLPMVSFRGAGFRPSTVWLTRFWSMFPLTRVDFGTGFLSHSHVAGQPTPHTTRCQHAATTRHTQQATREHEHNFIIAMLRRAVPVAPKVGRSPDAGYVGVNLGCSKLPVLLCFPPLPRFFVLSLFPGKMDLGNARNPENEVFQARNDLQDAVGGQECPAKGLAIPNHCVGLHNYGEATFSKFPTTPKPSNLPTSMQGMTHIGVSHNRGPL